MKTLLQIYIVLLRFFFLLKMPAVCDESYKSSVIFFYVLSNLEDFRPVS